VRRAPLLGAALLLAAAPAGAAEFARTEGFAGYSYARFADHGFHGWTAGLTYNVSHRLGFEFEGAGHSGTVDGTDLSRLSFLAGPRLSLRGGGAVPFARLLAGVLRTSSGITVQNVSIAARATDAAGAAGLGLDLSLGRRFGLRLTGDYFVVRADGETQGDPRAAIGVRYRLGP